jgi:Holliday junction resolvase
MAQPEARLSKKIVGKLKDCGAFASKVHGGPYQKGGLPDIIGCYEGRFFGIEVKMPGREKTLTERQANNLQVIKDAGGRVGVATTVLEALNILNGLTKWKNPYE